MQRAIGVLQIAGAVNAMACTDADLGGECGSLAQGRLSVGVWWKHLEDEPSAEGRAMAVLLHWFRACNPRAEPDVETTGEKATHMESVFHSLSLRPEDAPSAPQDDPFDIVQLNPGADVEQFTRCGTRQSSPQLYAIEDLPDADLLLREFHHEVMEHLRCDERTYALPVGIHRLNTLYYNRSLLESVGCSGADLHQYDFTTLVEDLHLALNGYAASGRTCVRFSSPSVREPALPILAVASEDPWTLSTFLFENLMLAAVGPDKRTAFWQGADAGAASGNSETLKATLDLYQKLAPYFSTPLKARPALDAVINGEAVFTVGGDWHGPELVGTDVELTAFPGTEATYVFTADVFAVPLNSPNPVNAAGWLRVITSEDVQRDYAALKGGASARTDVGPDLGAVELTPGLPVLIPDNTFAELDSLLGEWVRDGGQDPAKIVRYVASQYCDLSHADCASEQPLTGWQVR